MNSRICGYMRDHSFSFIRNIVNNDQNWKHVYNLELERVKEFIYVGSKTKSI